MTGASAIMRRAIARVDAAAETEGAIVGSNGINFADMDRQTMLSTLHAQAQLLAYYAEFYALVAPHVGRGFGQLGTPGRAPKPQHVEVT